MALRGPKGLCLSRVTEVTGKEFGGQSAAPPPLDASKTEPPHQGIPCLEVPGAAGMQGVGAGDRRRGLEENPVRVLAEGGAFTQLLRAVVPAALTQPF